MKTLVSIMLIAVACSSMTSTAGTEGESLQDFARQELEDVGAAGFVHIRDVSSGRILAHVSTTHGNKPELLLDAPVRPLSVIKVFVAALWLESGMGSSTVQCGRPPKPMTVEEVIVSGCDSAGAAMATELRKKLGARKVISKLQHYGLTRLKLQPSATDESWGNALTLGEDEVTTPADVSAFFRAIAAQGGGLLSPETARRLRLALRGVVERGTATSIKDSLSDIGWHIGGKTGTGPGECGEHCDGWFAAIAGDDDRDRDVILVFLREKGRGGGFAARIAAGIARHLAARPSKAP